ncbi:MAG: PRC-barrel domain-containing protein, partial [Pseudolabrys sp.]
MASAALLTPRATVAQPKEEKQDDSPEAKMARRFPQKVKVGDLIGLPLLDEDDMTLGHVQKVVRTPEGKIKLIVNYSKFFGWFGRPVAVPIEVVAILARQIISIDMAGEDYPDLPSWSQNKDSDVAGDEIIRIAL